MASADSEVDLTLMMPKCSTTKNLSTNVSLTFQFIYLSLVFQFHTFEEASNFIGIWFKELKHNPTEFTQDWPALLDKGCQYREELLKK